MCDSGVLPWLRTNKHIIILVATPLLLMPLPILSDTMASRTAYAIAIMAIYWITEATSLAVTSLLPLILFPLFGILEANVVCLEYMKDTNILLLGGLLIAVAIEQWNVHKRVALKILLLVGVQPRRLMLGFMMVTAFISMWITNTATTAMMTPIMEAVLKQLDSYYSSEDSSREEVNEVISKKISHVMIKSIELKAHEKQNLLTTISIGNIKKDHGAETEHSAEADHKSEADHKAEAEHGVETDNGFMESQITITEASSSCLFETQHRKVKKHKELCKGMMLCICYSANIGGIGTLTGSAPQLVLSGQMEQIFEKGPTVSFVFWFIHAFPLMCVFMIISWLYLQAVFMGISWKHLCFCFRGKKRNTKKGKELYAVMKQQYDDLGPVCFAEIEVMLSFLLLVILWFFREPNFIPGWGSLFKKKFVTDGTPAILIGFILFQLPSQVPHLFKPKGYPESPSKKQKYILDWTRVQKVFPWDVLFLLGAGFALAKACEASKLSLWLSCQLSALKVLSPFVVVLIVSVMVTFLTEITSNTATAAILLPILASLAQSIKVHPLSLMIPTTVCASFAFMLPVATPPNAIVFGTGRLSVKDMAKAGFGMNLIGILLITLSINTWGYLYYDLGHFPKWAYSSASNSSCSSFSIAKKSF